jgi:hypothetical protein
MVFSIRACILIATRGLRENLGLDPDNPRHNIFSNPELRGETLEVQPLLQGVWIKNACNSHESLAGHGFYEF